MKPVVQEKDELENGNEQFYGISFKIKKKSTSRSNRGKKAPRKIESTKRKIFAAA